MTETVKVMVRCRPMNSKENDRNCKNVVQIDSNLNQVSIIKQDSKDPPKVFSFDCVFGAESTQSYIYEQTAFALVDNVLEGYNGTIFAYGQTGCGKTHTMMGTTESQSSRGIIPRTFHQIITLTASETEKKHLVQCSFIEIYNEEIHDLLAKDIKAKMELKESPEKGVFVKDLSYSLVKTVEEMEKYMEIGFKNRAVRETAMNKQSSRSHSIFTIRIESEETDQVGKEKFKVGKLNLVDLAGSQRQSKTNATGDGMKEAAKINLSLSALGNVISALVDGKTQHIPYRDSKLTRLLQDSLGGNTKTIMIAAVSPADYNFQETLSTLRYASRAKFIQNKPKINQDPKDTLLRQYADQIKALKMMLEGKSPIDMSSLHHLPGQTEVIYKEILVERENDHLLENQLKSKEDLLKIQHQQKEQLKIQLQNLQKIVGKSDNEVDKKQLEKLKKMKEKIKMQKKKEDEWNRQKKKRDEELLTMQKSYKSLNQQVEQMRLKYMKIKSKYIQNLSQIKDLQVQFETEKQQLLDTIRNQQCEINKFGSILKMILTNDQIQQIISQSQYSDETGDWLIAPFYYREKSVNFPKLSSHQSKELIQNQRDKKEIVFKDIPTKHFHQAFNQYKNGTLPIPKTGKDYRVSEVVRGARETNERDKKTIDTSSNDLRVQTDLLFPNSKMKKQQQQQLNPLKMESEPRIKYEDISSANNITKLKLNPILKKDTEGSLREWEEGKKHLLFK